jgi:hypothetical protein
MSRRGFSKSIERALGISQELWRLLRTLEISKELWRFP